MNKKVSELLKSPEVQDFRIIAAFIIDKTPTTKDNEIANDIDSYSEVLKGIDKLNPTSKEMRSAAMRILKIMAKKTNKKFLGLILKIVDWFI